jgi:ubiquinone/menaquinone biosynthesis C-methylase UbiE
LNAAEERRIQEHYGRPEVVASYARHGDLQAGEETLFSRFQGEIRGRAVLELGVGTGRLTGPLAGLAGSYTGVDYAEGMLAACRARHPHLDLRQGDARDLGAFADGSFDFVLFGFNGIDDLAPEGRLRVLAEVFRVLRPGGLFAFSSHNLDAKRRSPLSLRGFELSAGWLRGYLARAANHMRMRRRERRGEGYAILNDSAYGARLLVYFASKEGQCRQLRDAGFTVIEMIGLEGARVDPDEPCRTPWIYYVARKPG